MKISRSAILWVFAAVLLLFLVLAAFTYSGLRNDQDLRADLVRDGEHVSGRIVDIYDGRRANHIDMEFRTVDGREVTARYRQSLKFPEIGVLTEGMIVDIAYDPADPSRAIPAPYETVPQRNVIAELLEFLWRIGLTLLIVSPLIVAIHVFHRRRSVHRATKQK